MENFDNLFAELKEKVQSHPGGSDTVRALGVDAHFRDRKIVEEVGEVWLVAEHESDETFTGETSQLLYWLQMVMIGRGLGLEDVYKCL